MDRGCEILGPWFLLNDASPSVPEYMALRSAVGWRVRSAEDCDRALRGTRLAVCAVDGDETIGMGRLVSDGALYWFIVDGSRSQRSRPSSAR